jgi:hypothetical protein
VSNGKALTFDIPSCKNKEMCEYPAMRKYLQQISFNGAGYDASTLSRNCEDISYIHKELDELGIPRKKIGITAQEHLKPVEGESDHQAKKRSKKEHKDKI